MSARSAMTMRARVSRKLASGTDPGGHPVAPSFDETAESVACKIWEESTEEVRDDGKLARVGDLVGMFPLGSSVQEEDELLVEDRQGELLFGGPIAIQTLSRKGAHASAGSHLRAVLRTHA